MMVEIGDWFWSKATHKNMQYNFLGIETLSPHDIYTKKGFVVYLCDCVWQEREVYFTILPDGNENSRTD